jgi:hypothetical protein
VLLGKSQFLDQPFNFQLEIRDIIFGAPFNILKNAKCNNRSNFTVIFFNFKGLYNILLMLCLHVTSILKRVIFEDFTSKRFKSYFVIQINFNKI